MALTPKNIKRHIASQTRLFVEELEKEIDRQLLHLFKPESRTTVRILVNPGKFSYKDVAEQLIALYNDTWQVDISVPENGYNINLDFSPK